MKISMFYIHLSHRIYALLYFTSLILYITFKPLALRPGFIVLTPQLMNQHAFIRLSDNFFPSSQRMSIIQVNFEKVENDYLPPF